MHPSFLSTAFYNILTLVLIASYSASAPMDFGEMISVACWFGATGCSANVEQKALDFDRQRTKLTAKMNLTQTQNKWMKDLTSYVVSSNDKLVQGFNSFANNRAQSMANNNENAFALYDMAKSAFSKTSATNIQLQSGIVTDSTKTAKKLTALSEYLNNLE